MHDVRQYWHMPPPQQAQVRGALAKADMEAYAEEHGLLLHQGKLLKPEEYPCLCEFEDPAPCANSLQNPCTCPCHTYYEPF